MAIINEQDDYQRKEITVPHVWVICRIIRGIIHFHGCMASDFVNIWCSFCTYGVAQTATAILASPYFTFIYLNCCYQRRNCFWAGLPHKKWRKKTTIYRTSRFKLRHSHKSARHERDVCAHSLARVSLISFCPTNRHRALGSDAENHISIMIEILITPKTWCFHVTLEPVYKGVD